MKKRNEHRLILSDEEEQRLMRKAEEANRTPVQYIRDLINSDNFKLYRLDIITNDMNEHTALIYRLEKKIESLCITIKRNNKIFPQDIEKIMTLLTEISEENRAGYKINSNERIKLYNEVLEHIKNKVKE